MFVNKDLGECDTCKTNVRGNLVGPWVPEERLTGWMEMNEQYRLKMIEKKCRKSSERSSQDCGYSSENNISSSSLPSTPEGSEVACSDICCNQENDLHSLHKLVHLHSSISIFKENGGGLTLTQMLEVRI